MTRLVLLSLMLGCGGPTSRTPDATIGDPPDDAPTAIDAAAPVAALWLLAHDGSTNRLYRVDGETLAIVDTKTVTYAGVLWELAGNVDGVAYSIDRDRDVMVKLDLATGEILGQVTLAGDMLQNGRGFGTGATGTLYGNFGGTRYDIDATSGILSNPVALEFGAMGESLEVCDGVMYMTSRETGSPRGENLYVVDVPTGAATLRGLIGPDAIDIDTLSCGLGNTLLGVDTEVTLGKTVFEIDPATAARTELATFAVLGDINGVHVTGTAAVD